MRQFQAFAIACVVLAFPGQALAEWVNATVTRQATVYRQANDTSEQLGHLREGKAIRVYTPDRNGFYAVNFGKPVKGAKTGWVAVGDIQLAGGDAAPQQANSAAAKPRRRGVKASWVDLTFGILMTSPTNFQETIGEEVKSVTGTSFDLTYGHQFPGSSLGYVLGAFYYKVDGTGNVSTYSAKGFGGSAGLDVQFVNQSQFVVSALASVGVSINSAGNTTTGTSGRIIDTSNILAFPIRAELDLHKYLSSFGFVLAGGYQIETLKEVPVVFGTTSEGIADFSVGGLYGRIGVSVNFE